MSQREIVVEEDISGPDGEAEKAGWLVHKMQIIGKRGCPDRWHFRRGVIVIIEYKKLGKDQDGLQKKRAREFNEQGFPVHVCRTHDDARRLLKLGIYG